MEAPWTRKQPQEHPEPKLKTVDVVWKEFWCDENNIVGHSDQFIYLLFYADCRNQHWNIVFGILSAARCNYPMSTSARLAAAFGIRQFERCALQSKN